MKNSKESNKKKIPVLSLILFLILSILSLVIISFGMDSRGGGEMTAEEIIKRRDDNEYFYSAYAEAAMLISKGGRNIEKTMLIYSKEKDALLEFTNPADRGTKFLKKGDNLWMFFPDAEDIVKISGHMLEQGLMGSDFSYQDMMESEKLSDLYQFSLLEGDIFRQRPCYVIEAVAKPGQKVSYYRRVGWIDRERFVGLKEEFYARSGRLLKVIEVQEIEQINDHWLPVQSTMVNKLRKDTQTKYLINKIELNIELDDKIFSQQSLR